ncbi:uncharacterized protein LOC132954467 [Labrus mixtus]|uniref:uncharacterized protein LOC132954467 n=1 Tax=Labrus mixtus TaxID=508554 RepID=UPI0029BFFEA4|nr:uncharacterized protein LOC132954467 [Labrus mixtus]
MYQWAEDDGDLPCGVDRLGLSEPVSGRRYVMYHGTTSQAARSIMNTGFQQSAGGMLGRGVYLSRALEKASRYPIEHPEHDRVVIKVVVNVGRVIAINYQGHPRQKNWHNSRYGEVFDTAWVPPRCGMVSSGLEENCVWDPDQIEIISSIKPRRRQPSAGYGAHGYMASDLTACTTGESRRDESDSNPDIIMQWAENDFDLPHGVAQLGHNAPVNDRNDTDNMYQWAEDDGDLPRGVDRLGLSEPVSGRRYVMYHGTTSQAARSIMNTGFQQSAGGMLGRGVYLSRALEKASRYPIKHPEHDRVVIKVVVNVGRVIAINYQGHPRQKNWHDSRYGEVFDTAWVPPRCGMVSSGLEENCVWDPDQIEIISSIKPRRRQRSAGYGAHGYIDTDTSMPYQWAEDDGGLPYGVIKLGHSQPVSGRRYVMYHGTTRQAAQSIKNRGFCRSKDGMLGPGVYLSRDLDKASRYPIGHPESERVVIKVVVDVGKVIAINRQGHPRQKTWHNSSYGEVYDTAWVPPNCGMVPSGLEEDCVWDPDRIEIIKIIQPRQSEGAGLAGLATVGLVGAAATLLFAAFNRN